MMNRQSADPLPVAPPVNTGIATALALRARAREAEQRIELDYLRLVSGFIKRRLLGGGGMAESDIIVNNDSVGAIGHGPESRIQCHAEVAEHEVHP